VYRYLCQNHKPGVDGPHQGEWQPDIVVGTSIGAVNGAAIVQGIDADDLLAFWRSLRERDIQGLPPTMTPLTRLVVNRILKGMIGVNLPAVARSEATSNTSEPNWPLPGLGRLGAAWLGRWASLLDTGPLRRTITTRLGLDEAAINNSQRTLLINATNVSTGQRATFSNRTITHRGSVTPRADVVRGISIQRILASCSIPLIYPWTIDPETHGVYWDGAVVANTPLGVSLDAANDRPPEDSMEVVVVLMTPWRDGSPAQQNDRPALPNDFSEALTWVLDWALLASFRERLDLIDAYNRLGRLGRRIGDPELAAIREVKVVIVAPQDFFPASRIIDYDERTNLLIEEGYNAADLAFQQSFAG
jgi:predicted acylesterase/phospholipase RssA